MLLSPRFTTSDRLKRVATGSRTISKGSGRRSRAVHLVQMALVDLGYPMPRSTRSRRYSPDGRFGNETETKLKEFQNRNNITETGKIDKDTILALDHFARNYRHSIRLHFKSISLTRVPFEDALKAAQDIFGQYAIKIEYASGQSLLLSEPQERRFNRISGECNWEINTGEYNELHGLGIPVPNNEISVYYVKRFDERNLLGCGGHAANRPACTVGSRASKFDTAHEVCHVLLTSSFSPVHINHRRNLMHPHSSNSRRMRVLTDKQVTQIRRSVCSVAI